MNRRLAKLRTETLHYVAGDTDSEYDRTSSSDLIGRKRKWGLFTWCCSGPGDVHTDANDILDGAFEDGELPSPQLPPLPPLPGR